MHELIIDNTLTFETSNSTAAKTAIVKFFSEAFLTP